MTLCPFIEQTQIYDAVWGHSWLDTLYPSVNAAKDYTDEYCSLFYKAPTTYTCPSDGNFSFGTTAQVFGWTNTAFCVGDHQSTRVMGQRFDSNGSVSNNASNRGVFDCRGLGDKLTIPDGTSNTVAISECVRPESELAFGANAIFDFQDADPLTAQATYDRAQKTYVSPATGTGAPYP